MQGHDHHHRRDECKSTSPPRRGGVRQTETLANTKNLDRVYGFVGSWIGFTPDGSPMVVLDVGTHDIYARLGRAVSSRDVCAGVDAWLVARRA